MGTFWKCQFCGTPFDTFVSGASCPQCASRFDATSCLDCGRSNPIAAWTATM
jgi:DNA-directed RNA polymerase subunit RPC12/RpoP